MEKKRDIAIDGIRGLAVICMMYAHLIPHYQENGTQLFFFERIISSLAAPLFLFLVGYNFNVNQVFVNLLKRVFVTLIIAAIIDTFIWNIFPFYSFDVLYIIGFSLIFIFLIKNLKQQMILFLILFIVLTSSIIQYLGYYSISLYEPYFNQEYKVLHVIYNFFINGWFPFFPWIIFPIIGLITKNINFENGKHKALSIFIFVCTITIICFYNNFNWRTFAVEIFYPASFQYLILSISYIYFIWVYKQIFYHKFLGFLTQFGKLSLLIYILHLTIYSFLGDLLISKFPNRFYCFIFVISCFWFILFLINNNKFKWKVFQKNTYVRILLGN